MELEKEEAVKKLVAAFEKDRIKAKKTFVIMLAIGIPLLIASIALFVVFFIVKQSQVILSIAFILLIASIVLLCIASYKKQKFTKTVLGTFTSYIEERLFPGLVKNPNGGFDLKELMKPGFFEEPDRYLYSNRRDGVYKNIPFASADYRLQRRERHDDGKNVYYTYTDYAVGTMYHFTFERDFAASVKIVEKTGFLNFAPAGFQKVETEYIDFNKHFMVYATDQTLVFYLLTPQMQEKIMALEEMFKGQFYMDFVGNELFIAINDNFNSLKVPFMKPLTEEIAAKLMALIAVPAIFTDQLGLSKAKYQKDAGTSIQ